MSESLTFRGRWEDCEPEAWEEFTLQLHGKEAGDVMTDRAAILRVLREAGLALVPLDYKGQPKVTNEMKAECIGEFSWKEDAPYYDENGALHDGERENVVPWDLCKNIYKAMAAVAIRVSNKAETD